jgi:NAD(P) transhydrogenase subunit alpha
MIDMDRDDGPMRLRACHARRAERRKRIRKEKAKVVDPIVFYLIIFVLAVFVGYHVVWSVTPALHTPLMSVTNAISAIVLVGAMLAAGPAAFDWGGWVGVVAVVLASINAFGGFLVTQRMLEMFKRKEPAKKPAAKP